MKKISLYWAVLAGLLSVAAQVLTFYFRFGRWNTFSTAMDYVMFFLAGTFGGLMLIYFLNRQASVKGRWSVLIAFLIGTPLAILMMMAGGVLGPLGVLIFPQIPWTMLIWSGTLVAKFLTRS